jgi:hypothetical protein
LIPSPPNSVGLPALLVWFAVSQDAQLIQAFRLIGSLPAIASVEVFCGIWARKYPRFLPLSRFSIVAMPAL